MKFNEVLFTRSEEQTSGKTKTVTFTRVQVLKQVTMTQPEADILNAGRTESPGNTSFTLFLKEGDPDPAPVDHVLRKTGPSSPVDEKGNLSTGIPARSAHDGIRGSGRRSSN